MWRTSSEYWYYPPIQSKLHCLQSHQQSYPLLRKLSPFSRSLTKGIPLPRIAPWLTPDGSLQLGANTILVGPTAALKVEGSLCEIFLGSGIVFWLVRLWPELCLGMAWGRALYTGSWGRLGGIPTDCWKANGSLIGKWRPSWTRLRIAMRLRWFWGEDVGQFYTAHRRGFGEIYLEEAADNGDEIPSSILNAMYQILLMKRPRYRRNFYYIIFILLCFITLYIYYIIFYLYYML